MSWLSGCPKCQKAIVKMTHDLRCPECGAELPETLTAKLPRMAAIAGSAVDAPLALGRDRLDESGAWPSTSPQYKVVPFSAAVASAQSGSALAAEVERIILSQTASGWEYVGVHQLQTVVAGSSGCFGLGATPPTTTTSEFVVFRR